MPVFEIRGNIGGLSDFEDKGIAGSFKFGSNLDIRKDRDSLSCQQALVDIGVTLQSASASVSPSSSVSPSVSNSPSPSRSTSPSSSVSPSNGGSSSPSPSSSTSPSASGSPSASVSPSNSVSSSPSPSAGLKTVFSDLVHYWVKCSDGFLYGFGNTGKVYKIDVTNRYVQQVYDAGQEIRGAFEKPSASGKRYLLFATKTNLHRKEIPGKANWNDVNAPGSVQGDTWPKTNLTDTPVHTMNNVGGDILIANGSALAMSAYDDSYTNEALDLIPGNTARTILERSGFAVVGTGIDAEPSKQVNGAIDSEVSLAQVGDKGDIYFADGTNSVPVKHFPGGGKVNPGGVANKIDKVLFFQWQQDALTWINKQAVGNLAMFGVYGGDKTKSGVYTYGRVNKNAPFTLNLDYLMNVDEVGAITHMNDLTVASYKIGSQFGVLLEDPNTKATAVYEGLDFYSPVLLYRHQFKRSIDISKYSLVELFMMPLPQGCSVEFWYRIDKTGPFVRANTTDGHSSYSQANGQRAIFSIGAQGKVWEPRIVLNPSGNNSPEVLYFLTYFD